MVNNVSSNLNRTFSALADPTRRLMLARLAQGSANVAQLARPHAMSAPAISKHLRVLEEAGLIHRRRLGRVHEVKLDPAPLQEASAWVGKYQKFWTASLDRLDALLAEEPPAAQAP